MENQLVSSAGLGAIQLNIMYLRSLTLINFRCYEHLEIHTLDKLAIFIGENDAGKTVILDAIEILVDKGQTLPSDFRKLPLEGPVSSLSIKGTFQLTPNDLLPVEYRNEDQLVLERTFRLEPTGQMVSEVSVVCVRFEDPRIETFSTLKAAAQDELLMSYGLTPGKNAPIRAQQLSDLINKGTITRVEGSYVLPVTKVNSIKPFLPRIERISSKEYQHPESVIRRTFQTIAADIIAPMNPATNQRKEIDELASVRKKVQAKLDEEVAKIQPLLSRDHRNLKNVSVYPTIDFTKSVAATTISLDCGEGEQSFDAFGEGTKRRIWMGLLNWERQALDERAVRNTLRLYDEPDVNLHYQAQRQLFENILSLADNDEAEIQCFVCTHSVHLIDRAPLHSVNLVRVDEDAKRTLVRIHGLDDSDYTNFYEEVGEAIGLSNTALLYERAFLVVEGPSEEQAIPIIYRNIYKRSMRDDGIRIFNLETCGAWKSVLSILLKNRLEVVHILLDQDCTSPNSTAKIHPDTLHGLGCPEDFATNQVTYIGTKEFEDAFASNVILTAIKSHVEMVEELNIEDIDNLKASSEKFSEAIIQRTRACCKVQDRGRLSSKPMMAVAVAKQCTSGSLATQCDIAYGLNRDRRDYRVTRQVTH